MKLKKIVVSILLFLISLPAFAGMCFPDSQVYINNDSQSEKYLPCGEMLNNPLGSLLNKFTGFPLTTTSFVKSGISYDFGVDACGGKDITRLERLAFSDFSILDKIKIIINAFFLIIIMLLPLGLFLLIYHRVKSLALRIILDIILAFMYLAWILYLFLSLGTCR